MYPYHSTVETSLSTEERHQIDIPRPSHFQYRDILFGTVGRGVRDTTAPSSAGISCLASRSSRSKLSLVAYGIHRGHHAIETRIQAKLIALWRRFIQLGYIKKDLSFN